MTCTGAAVLSRLCKLEAQLHAACFGGEPSSSPSNSDDEGEGGAAPTAATPAPRPYRAGSQQYWEDGSLMELLRGLCLLLHDRVRPLVIHEVGCCRRRVVHASLPPITHGSFQRVVHALPLSRVHCTRLDARTHTHIPSQSDTNKGRDVLQHAPTTHTSPPHWPRPLSLIIHSCTRANKQGDLDRLCQLINVVREEVLEGQAPMRGA